jgi:acetylornithine/succinyldiaminopimelate/putrescine aminotransferase
LANRAVLVKDTHCFTLRFAPPLVITAQEIDWAVGAFLGQPHQLVRALEFLLHL